MQQSCSFFLLAVLRGEVWFLEDQIVFTSTDVEMGEQRENGFSPRSRYCGQSYEVKLPRLGALVFYFLGCVNGGTKRMDAAQGPTTAGSLI